MADTADISNILIMSQLYILDLSCKLKLAKRFKLKQIHCRYILLYINIVYICSFGYCVKREYTINK